MNLKRIIGSHFANYRESLEANRLVSKGLIHPTVSKVYPLAETGQAAMDVHSNRHQGKVGVLALAPHEGLGVTRPRAAGEAPRTDQPVPRYLTVGVVRVRVKLTPRNAELLLRSDADGTV